jgi:hypothetical protein
MTFLLAVSLTLGAVALLLVCLVIWALIKRNHPMILPDFEAPLADINSKLDTLIAAASAPPTGATPQDVADTLAAVTALQSKVDAAVAALPQP